MIGNRLVFSSYKAYLLNKQIQKTPKWRHLIRSLVLEVGLASNEVRTDVLLFEHFCETKMVLEVGLEPTKAEAGRFTVSCHCH